MLKKISVILILSLVVTFAANPVIAATGYHQGVADGEHDANRSHSSTGFLVGSLAGSVLISPLLVGGGIVVGAYLSNPKPDSYILAQLERDKGIEYARGYEHGYTEKARSKNVTGAWIGTGTGLVVNVVLTTILFSQLENSINGNNMSEDQSHIPIMNLNFAF